MDKVKCSNGHFFDRDKFSSCPFCGGAFAGQAGTGGSKPPVVPSRRSSLIQDSVTQMLEPREAPVSRRIEPVAPAPAGSLVDAVEATGFGEISTLPKTTSYYDQEDVEPTVGWLVCVKGVYRGRTFPCRTGRNTVGRDPGHGIRLEEDTSVTRKTHAVLIYEPQKRQFFIQNGTGSGLVYHNGEPLFAHEGLEAYDTIQIGKGEYLFLPLCGERFSWDI